jgi:hypothetical protein
VSDDDQVSITFTPKLQSSTNKIFEWYKQSLTSKAEVVKDVEWFFEGDDIPDDFVIPAHIQIIDSINLQTNNFPALI